VVSVLAVNVYLFPNALIRINVILVLSITILNAAELIPLPVL